MKLKSLFTIFACVIGMSACSTLEKVVYRIDVPQGNYLEQDKIDQLQIGMNQEQVKYLLGSPVLKDVFNQNRWDYVFIKREGHKAPIQHTLLIYFDQNGLVKEIKLDKIISENKDK